MRYQPETTKNQSTINPHRYALGWIVGFPGYVILVACWLGVLVGLSAWLMSLLQNNDTQIQNVPAPIPASQTALLQVPSAFIWLLGIASIGALLLFYWLIVKYAKQIIQAIADHFDKPVVAIKLFGLVIGCVSSSIVLTLARHDLGTLPLILGSWALGIGIVSFVLEYLLSK